MPRRQKRANQGFPNLLMKAGNALWKHIFIIFAADTTNATSIPTQVSHIAVKRTGKQELLCFKKGCIANVVFCL